jgi:Mg2+ and Co2+ transporter CorA
MVAIATKRDSTAMKSISLLTMVFLPPTFVAVGQPIRRQAQ